jgi:arginyl-tRNA synthetase
LRKAAEAGHAPWSPAESSKNEFLVETQSEGDLLRMVNDFNTVVQDSAEQYRPSHLCTHLFYMCKAFNRFYSDVPILKADSPATVRMRLTIIRAFALTLKQGLALLGITPPERM